ncbi:MAG: lipopolysaccharide biosynthesis protein [Muribaculaceae bacterium]|nr:lipopolysaccharide biosynthesis protein [Muribaculaceae bacterium]
MDSLKEKTANSLSWSLLNSGLTQVLNLVIGIFLARLLTPAEYGIVGVLTIFTLLAGNIQTCGFAQALINLKNPTRNDYNSVFWFNVITSFILYAILFAAAPLIARYFHEPRLVAVSRVTFLVFLISSFSIAHIGYMNKRLMNKETAIISLTALSVSGIVGVTLALNGWSYWSLAWQQVTYVTVLTLGRYYYTPWMFSFRIDFGPVKRMFGFSVKILLTNMLNTLSTQVLTFIFGRMFPMRDVGNYSQANKWNLMANALVYATVDQVAQPVLVTAGDERERRKRVFRKLLRFASFVSFPAMLGLSLVSRELILVTIGNEWLEAIPLLQVLCVGGAFIPMHHAYQHLSISCGRSDIYLWANASQIVLMIASVLVVSHLGIYVMVMSFTIFTILWTLVWHFITRYLLGMKLRETARDILPYFAVAAVVMVITGLVTRSVPHLAALLAVRVVLGAALYGLCMWLLHDEMMQECVHYVAQRLPSNHTKQ